MELLQELNFGEVASVETNEKTIKNRIRLTFEKARLEQYGG